MPDAITPPAKMGFFEALTWCETGWAIRLTPWRLTAAIAGQVAASGDLPLVWITGVPSGRPGVYLFVSDDGNGVVQNIVLQHADMRRYDWTCLPPDGASSNARFTDPNSGGAPAPAGARSGGSSGGSGGGSGEGDGGFSFGGISGGGGDPDTGGGGGGGGGTSASIVVDQTRESGDTCVALLAGDLPVTDPISDTFFGNVTLNDSGARPGDLWSVTVLAGSPSGFETLYHGTMAAGDTQGWGPITRTAMPGTSFSVWATAHLMGSSREDLRGDTTIEMRTNCLPTGGGGGGGGGGGDDTPVYGCMDSHASNYNSSATNDDGSCIYCPTGWHWDPGLGVCVED